MIDVVKQEIYIVRSKVIIKAYIKLNKKVIYIMKMKIFDWGGKRLWLGLWRYISVERILENLWQVEKYIVVDRIFEMLKMFIIVNEAPYLQGNMRTMFQMTNHG